MMYHTTYLSDGLKVKGYLCFPHGFDLPISALRDYIHGFCGSGKLPIRQIACSAQAETQDIRCSQWPVFLYCRGGMGRVGSVQTHWLEQFARFGHIVFAPCYRGSEGGEGRDEFGGSDREDVMSAIRLLESLPFVDADRISVMGFSRGSINAAHAAIANPRISSLILWSGVSDLAQTYEERVDLRRMLKRVIGGSPGKKSEDYAARSPIQLAERVTCPVLVIHGTKDVQVDFCQGRNMYHRLRETGATAEFHAYEGLGHHFPPDIHYAAMDRMFHWMGRSDGDQSPLSPLSP